MISEEKILVMNETSQESGNGSKWIANSYGGTNWWTEGQNARLKGRWTDDRLTD